MAEEFEESEIVFQESFEDEDSNEKFSKELRNRKAMKRKKTKINTETKQKSTTTSSAPVNIPEVSAWQLRYNMNQYPDLDGDDREMEPPHLITRRRVAGKMMSLSVCSGYGRTLKGRDMRQVRNSILRMTGFLET